MTVTPGEVWFVPAGGGGVESEIMSCLRRFEEALDGVGLVEAGGIGTWAPVVRDWKPNPLVKLPLPRTVSGTLMGMIGTSWLWSRSMHSPSMESCQSAVVGVSMFGGWMQPAPGDVTCTIANAVLCMS